MAPQASPGQQLCTRVSTRQAQLSPASWAAPAPERCPVVSFRKETQPCTLLPWLDNRTWSGNW